MGEIYLKLHERIFLGSSSKVLALCDAELLEEKRVLREGEIVIDLSKCGRFYGGEKTDAESAVQRIKKAGRLSSANAVGRESVKAAREAFKCGGGSESFVNGVPMLQLYFL